MPSSNDCIYILGDETWRKHINQEVAQARSASRMTAQLAAVARLQAPDTVRQTVMDTLAGDWDAAMLLSTFDLEREVGGESLAHLIAPFLSPLALRWFAASPSWVVRYVVALHEQTPADTRQHLSPDGNRYVRAMARAKAAQMKEEGRD